MLVISSFWIQIQIANPDPGTQLNPDPDPQHCIEHLILGLPVSRTAVGFHWPQASGLGCGSASDLTTQIDVEQTKSDLALTVNANSTVNTTVLRLNSKKKRKSGV